MEIKDYFNKMVKNNFWDGRKLGIPFFFAVVAFDENTGLKSQELAEVKNGKYFFLNN